MPSDKVVLTDGCRALGWFVAMPRTIEDILGKNVLRDLFQLRGSAEIEAEVPPGEATRLDLWFVPEPEKVALDIPYFTGVMAKITAEPAAVELWSASPRVDHFFAGLVKRELWRDILRKRDKRPWSRPMLWHICAGKPEKVLDEFGHEPTEIPGWYRPHRPGLRVQIVVICELSKTRDTILLRLLGRGQVRRNALREFRALPKDAWEKQVASDWLVKVGLEVTVDSVMSQDDREFVMDIKDYVKNHDREVEERVTRRVEKRVLRSVEPRLVEERTRGELNPLARQFERRIGRPLSADERDALAVRIKKQGSAPLADLVLDLSGPELAAWLEKNGVAKND